MSNNATLSGVHCYLAGPDVFYADAITRGESKKALLAKMDIKGHFPFDNEIPPELFASDLSHASKMIADENEKMMLRCADNGNVAVMLMNMTPWRGAEMDSGTAFEAGFMSAMRRMGKNVIIVGYYEKETPPFSERVREWCKKQFGEEPKRGADGYLRDKEGVMIEDFPNNQDNLMIDEAIKRTGGRICFGFEEAATLAKELSDRMIQELASRKTSTPKAAINSVEPQSRVSLSVRHVVE